MPPKVRELIEQLEQAGFQNRGGKGSHRNFVHPRGGRPVTISGKVGDDAKRYQERGRQGAPGDRDMKDSARYVKLVEWSEEDECYVGSSPGLLYGGCHGDDEEQVFHELVQIVEETISVYRAEGRQLPPATSGRDLANTIESVA